MKHLIQPVRGPAAVHVVRRALVGILTTLIGAAA